MDMTVQSLVNLFLNMDGKSRGMFIKLLVVKLEEEEVDLLLQVLDTRNLGHDDLNNVDKKIKLEPQKTCDSNGAENTCDSNGPENRCDSKGPVNTCDSKGPVNTCDSNGPKNKFDSNRPENRCDSKGPVNTSDSKGPVNTCDSNRPENRCDSKGPVNTCDSNGGLHSLPLGLPLDHSNKLQEEYKEEKVNLLHQTEKGEGLKPFLCQQCPYKSGNKKLLKRHTQKYHITNSENFKSHVKQQTKEKRFICDQCDYQTFKMCTMNVHNRTHTGERPCLCNLCSKTFITNAHLNRHIKGVHKGERPRNLYFTGEKKYLCDLCSSAFSTQGSEGTLLRHKKSIHEGINHDGNANINRF